jgi:hypothetical protein
VFRVNIPPISNLKKNLSISLSTTYTILHYMYSILEIEKRTKCHSLSMWFWCVIGRGVSFIYTAFNMLLVTSKTLRNIYWQNKHIYIPNPIYFKPECLLAFYIKVLPYYNYFLFIISTDLCIILNSIKVYKIKLISF